ncbi:MAG TPA: hypothetical protein VFM34_08775 [Moraxellaceae bacterium]|nr:hypothetical protein [Moraxellaceae bacterium]
MQAKRALTAVAISLLVSGCTTTYVAVTEHSTRPARIFPKAIDIDVQCLALPFTALPALTGGARSPGDALGALYLAGGIFAYGAIDLSFTAPGYVVYRTSRIAAKALDNFVNR